MIRHIHTCVYSGATSNTLWLACWLLGSHVLVESLNMFFRSSFPVGAPPIFDNILYTLYSPLSASWMPVCHRSQYYGSIPYIFLRVFLYAIPDWKQVKHVSLCMLVSHKEAGNYQNMPWGELYGSREVNENQSVFNTTEQTRMFESRPNKKNGYILYNFQQKGWMFDVFHK